jgi:peptidoglycan/xylan/chitin deacetylase (PgdA/CDA1 family)
MSFSGLFKSRFGRIGAVLLVTVSLGQFTVTPAAQAAGETVVSLTFNDGLLSQYLHARPVLQAHNMTGTFYLSSKVVEANAPGYMATWHADALYRDGDEIGGLTKDHIDLTDQSQSLAYRQDQVCGDRQRLAALGYDPQSFSYPFAAVNPEAEGIVQGCGYRSGRTVGGLSTTTGPYAETNPPADAFRLSTASIPNGPVQLTALQGAVNSAASNGGGWLPVAFNQVCNSASGDYSACMASYQPIDASVLSAFLGWLQNGAPAGVTVSRVRDVMGAGPQPALSPRPTAISLTFDDGLVSQYRLRTILSTHQARGSFFIPSGAVDAAEQGTMTWAQIHNLAADGHDIGGHTRDHVDLTTADTTYDYKWRQVCDDRARLQAQGFSPASFAYPYAAFNATAAGIVQGCGYQSGRSGGSLLVGGPLYSEVIPPPEPFSYKALGTTYDGPITLQYLQDAINGPADRAGGWVPLIFHEICYHADANFNACMAGYRVVDDTTLDQFLSWLTANAGRGISVKTVADVMGGGQTAPNVGVSTPTAGQTAGTSPTVSGTASPAGGDVSVALYQGPYSTGTPLMTVTATNSNGAWTTAIPGPLADGTYTAQARQTGSGLTGYSPPRTFVVSSTADTTAPVVQISAPQNGSSVSNTRPVISGTGGRVAGDSATVTVRIYAGPTATGTALRTMTGTVAAAGTWSVTPATALAQGTYTAQATQSDTAGNVGTSAATTVTVDTVKPVVRITSPANNATVTTTAAFTVSGTAGVLAGDGTLLTLRIYPGTVATGTAVSTLTSTASAGAWSTSVPGGLAAGSYAMTASQLDAAGNIGISSTVVVRLRSAQTVTSLSPTAIGQGVTGRTVLINGSGFTAGSTVAFTGTGVALRSTTFVSATRLSTVVDVAPNATTGLSNVVVSQPGTFDATCANCLTVNASPIPTSAAPSTVSRGSAQSVTINGTGFVAASQVTFSGTGISVVVNSRTATAINLTLSIGASATLGSRNVTVRNPDLGTGTCVGCLTIT